MNIPFRLILGCAFVAATSIAATSSNPQNRLTVRRVLQLTAPNSAPSTKSWRVKVSSLGEVLLPADKPEGQITSLQETFFPTEFVPPQADSARSPLAIVPATPTDFEKLQTGWTVRLSAKSMGKLVAVSGLANFVEAGAISAGYGEVAAPVYADGTDVVVTPNVMNMARVQTTTTRFQVFATPGRTYEVTIYHGAKAEKHQVSVAVE